MVTLLDPLECKYYSPNAQKGGLNVCDVRFFIFEFLVYFRAVRGKTCNTESNCKGHEISFSIYGINGLDKNPSDFFFFSYSFAKFKSL